jgi:glycerol-3-phosphate cytidylyltransferase
MAQLAKDRAPVVPLVERLEIVRSIGFVDAAFVETVPDKLETWKQVRFDVIFKGDDWRGTPKGDRLERDFATVGVEVVYFPYTVHTSSTLLRQALDALTAQQSPITGVSQPVPGTTSP